MIVVERTCPKCKATYRSNAEHACTKPRVVTSKAKSVVTKLVPITTEPVTTVTTPSARVKAWRAENREHYNEYMRGLRKRRAKAKEAGK